MTLPALALLLAASAQAAPNAGDIPSFAELRALAGAGAAPALETPAPAADALSADLAAASKSVHIEVFQWQADDVGWSFARTLAARAAAGVRVRVLVDQFGSDTDDPEVSRLLDFLRAGGVQAVVRPAPLSAAHLDHRKVVVIDGTIGFTGGMNIGALYQAQWHDQLSEIQGPAVAALQTAFLRQWGAAGGPPPAEKDLFPAPAPQPGGVETLAIAHQGGGKDANIKTAYLDAFAAARRGVAVQLVLPRVNDEPFVQAASRAYYPDLIAAGVEVYEYLPRMAHDKVAVVDDELTLFGSSNLDARSLDDNDELDVAALGAGPAADAEHELFAPDLKASERVRAYDPSLPQDAARAVSRLLAPRPPRLASASR